VLSAPGEIDVEIGEYWLGNPWLFHEAKKNLSAYERNRVYLNHDGKQFLEISYLSGADSDGDARSSVIADLTGDGMEDVLVRQTGGGPVLLFENRIAKQHWLKVALRGRQSNSLGIGSRLVAEVSDRRIVRELYPANTFYSQTPSYAYFGLGDAAQVDRLTIRWPSGTTQVLERVAGDRHIEVTEGESELRIVTAQ
jgi:hypothetical protein